MLCKKKPVVNYGPATADASKKISKVSPPNKTSEKDSEAGTRQRELEIETAQKETRVVSRPEIVGLEIRKLLQVRILKTMSSLWDPGEP